MNAALPAVSVLLAVAWGAVTGSFALGNLIVGFVLGWGGLWLIRGEIGAGEALGRGRRLLALALLFLYELVVSTLRVAWLVLQPRMPIRPAIVAYPLKVDRDYEITLLANLITLTPGTLSVDVSPDRRTLYIHAIDVGDPERLKEDIANGFERRIMEAFR
jgi:multicomponent Na+:H+ antiporter subunit E